MKLKRTRYSKQGKGQISNDKPEGSSNKDKEKSVGWEMSAEDALKVCYVR